MAGRNVHNSEKCTFILSVRGCKEGVYISHLYKLLYPQILPSEMWYLIRWKWFRDVKADYCSDVTEQADCHCFLLTNWACNGPELIFGGTSDA